MLKKWCALLSVALMVGAGAVHAQSIVVASTTSTEQSGLFGHILPQFTQATGIQVRVVALGTGQAIDVARRGDADVLFVHDKAAEERFVADGFGVQRLEVMYNDFILVGPSADPAQARGNNIVQALERLAQAQAPFISRGDNSGTHAAEKRFWAMAPAVTNRGSGYQECGCGMGPALNMASARNAYVLTDRGTWLSFRNRGDLRVLVEGDPRLFNQYGVMLVNAARHPHVKTAEGQRFIDWLVGPQGQAAIASYQIEGQQLFFPNAVRN